MIHYMICIPRPHVVEMTKAARPLWSRRLEVIDGGSQRRKILRHYKLFTSYFL